MNLPDDTPNPFTEHLDNCAVCNADDASALWTLCPIGTFLWAETCKASIMHKVRAIHAERHASEMSFPA